MPKPIRPIAHVLGSGTVPVVVTSVSNASPESSNASSP